MTPRALDEAQCIVVYLQSLPSGVREVLRDDLMAAIGSKLYGGEPDWKHA